MPPIFSVLELEPECSVRPTEVRRSASAAECHHILEDNFLWKSQHKGTSKSNDWTSYYCKM